MKDTYGIQFYGKRYVQHYSSTEIESVEFGDYLPGSGSRIADFSNPLASSELYGAKTFSPGQLAYHGA